MRCNKPNKFWLKMVVKIPSTIFSTLARISGCSSNSDMTASSVDKIPMAVTTLSSDLSLLSNNRLNVVAWKIIHYSFNYSTNDRTFCVLKSQNVPLISEAIFIIAILSKGGFRGTWKLKYKNIRSFKSMQ